MLCLLLIHHYFSAGDSSLPFSASAFLKQCAAAVAAQQCREEDGHNSKHKSKSSARSANHKPGHPEKGAKPIARSKKRNPSKTQVRLFDLFRD